MKKYNILVIPDIHTKHIVIQDFLDEVEYDRAIFLADYFDDFGDTIESNVSTAKWLKSSLDNPKHIHLLGNHDLPYFTDGEGLYCSGYHPHKNSGINKILRKKDWEKLKTFHLQTINKKKFLFTHAGLTKHYFSGKNIRSFLGKYDKIFKKDPLAENWMTNVGLTRGGYVAKGGIFWCDCCEFEPIEGLHQIFGHTPQINNDLQPTELFPDNWCIDTHLDHLANITKKGKIEIISLMDYYKWPR